MKLSATVQLAPRDISRNHEARNIRPAFISAFQEIAPRFRGSQKAHLRWLAEAHIALGNADPKMIRESLARCNNAANPIAFRHHELPDFSHRTWNTMRLFSPGGSTIEEKTRFFDEAVLSVFERLYPVGRAAPQAIVHVTCTGYSAPSGAQKLVSQRDWGRQTQVLHAYHMGCYAAHPALRIAAGQMAYLPRHLASVDVVHTELCTLHLDPSQHAMEQLVIQSLFADGHMKYEVTASPPRDDNSFEVVALHDEIIPDSIPSMKWVTGPFLFAMTLSKEVPVQLGCALDGFVQRIFERAGLDYATEKSEAVFAIHPGGPRIIDLAEKLLRLDPAQAAWSRDVLREHGNMSSATLPHIWKTILDDDKVAPGTLIVSLGAGPGLTVSGALLRKHIA